MLHGSTHVFRAPVTPAQSASGRFYYKTGVVVITKKKKGMVGTLVLRTDRYRYSTSRGVMTCKSPFPLLAVLVLVLVPFPSLLFRSLLQPSLAACDPEDPEALARPSEHLSSQFLALHICASLAAEKRGCLTAILLRQRALFFLRHSFLSRLRDREEQFLREGPPPFLSFLLRLRLSREVQGCSKGDLLLVLRRRRHRMIFSSLHLSLLSLFAILLHRRRFLSASASDFSADSSTASGGQYSA